MITAGDIIQFHHEIAIYKAILALGRDFLIQA